MLHESAFRVESDSTKESAFIGIRIPEFAFREIRIYALQVHVWWNQVI